MKANTIFGTYSILRRIRKLVCRKKCNRLSGVLLVCHVKCICSIEWNAFILNHLWATSFSFYRYYFNFALDVWTYFDFVPHRSINTCYLPFTVLQYLRYPAKLSFNLINVCPVWAFLSNLRELIVTFVLTSDLVRVDGSQSEFGSNGINLALSWFYVGKWKQRRGARWYKYVDLVKFIHLHTTCTVETTTSSRWGIW